MKRKVLTALMCAALIATFGGDRRRPRPRSPMAW